MNDVCKILFWGGMKFPFFWQSIFFGDEGFITAIRHLRLILKSWKYASINLFELHLCSGLTLSFKQKTHLEHKKVEIIWNYDIDTGQMDNMYSVLSSCLSTLSCSQCEVRGYLLENVGKHPGTHCILSTCFFSASIFTSRKCMNMCHEASYSIGILKGAPPSLQCQQPYEWSAGFFQA